MSRFSWFSLLLLPLFQAAGAAQEKAPFTPFVDDTTMVVGRVNVAKVDLNKYFQAMEGFAINPKEFAALRGQVLGMQAKFLKAGGTDLYLILNAPSIKEPPDFLIVAPLSANADEQALAELGQLGPGVGTKKVGGALVLSGEKTLAGLGQFQPKARQEFTQGLQALADQHLAAVFSPPQQFRQFVEQLVPKLPKELGGGDITLLTRLPWAAVSYDTVNQAQKIIVQAKDPAAAKDLEQLAHKALDLAHQLPAAKDLFPDLGKVAGMVKMKAADARFTVTLDEQVINEALKQAVVKVRAAAARTQSANNLRQIILAFHNAHAVGKAFPARANFDANGKPLLSWRVHILPFIEQERLYRQFKLNEPWDSEHNKKLIAQMPAIYQSPLSKLGKVGKTTYLVPTGKDTIFSNPMGMRLQDITDGTSNTILALEVSDSKAVTWTQPEDFEVNAKNPAAGLALPQMKGFHAAFADGSVRFLSAAIQPQNLLGLFSPRGGEIVNPD